MALFARRIVIVREHLEAPPVIFAYWDRSDHTILAEMIAAWREHFLNLLCWGIMTSCR